MPARRSWTSEFVAPQQLPINIHPNNREAVAESDCLWQSCTERTRCHISLAVSLQRRRHSLNPLHSLRLNRCQRRLPLLSLHVRPLIQVQHLQGPLMRCQRQRYQQQRHSPPAPATGTLSLAERKSGSTDHLPGKTHKTCADRAWLRTMGRLDRYRRIPHT